MEINEKTLKAFITKQKGKVLRKRKDTLSSDVYHWWMGYQEMLWMLELFQEGHYFNSEGNLETPGIAIKGTKEELGTP